MLYAARGDKDSAFGGFQRIKEWAQSPLYGWPNVSLRYLYPDALGPLRGDFRYDRLIRKINTVWGLNPDGSLPDSVDVSFGS